MDPIANMLIMMKNASRAGKSAVILPYSKLKLAIGECLKREGYIADIAKLTRRDREMLEVTLLYTGKAPKITEVERVSRQSRRIYFGIKDIHTVRNKSGILVLSTPKGILSGSQARREHVGGEPLFKLW